MSGCLPCSRFQQEYVRLLRNCYPSTAAQEVANSSAVSYLCFYANSHPSKLPLIAKWLEKRIRRDYSSSKAVQVRIGLEIVSGLSAECEAHVARFGRIFLNIFLSLLGGSTDNDIFASVMDTFATFSKHYDHGTLDFDQDFRKSYLAMLKHCQKGSLTDQPNLSKRNRARLASLKAIHAVIAHPSFQNTAELEEYHDVIMPSLLNNITLPVDPAKEPAAGEGPVPPTSAVSREAESCLVLSMQAVNAANLWRILRPFYRATEAAGFLYVEPARAEYILDICVASVNPIFRPALVDVAVKRLLNITNKQLTMPTKPLTRQGRLTLIRMLTKTISTGGLAVGVTVLELVDSLTQLLYKSIEDIVRSREADGGRISEQERVEMKELEDALVKCIGALAISIYYPTQVNDIIGFIVNRLKIETLPRSQALAAAEGKAITDLTDNELVLLEVRKSLVRCLRQVMENTVSGSQSSGIVQTHISLPGVDESLAPPEMDAGGRRTSISDAASAISEMGSHSWSASVRRAPVPEEYVTPMVVFLQSHDVDLRVEFGLFLFYFLNDVSELKDGSAINTFNAKQLRHELHTALYETPFFDYSLPVDYVIAYLTLVSLLQKFGGNEVFEAVPLTFALQDRAMAELKDKPLQRDAIYGILTRYYESMAHQLGSSKLQGIVGEHLKGGDGLDWLFGTLSVLRIEELRDKNWSDASMGSTGSKVQPLQRAAIVEALVTDASLPPRSDLKEALEASYDPKGPLLPDPEPPKVEISEAAKDAEVKAVALSSSVLQAIAASESVKQTTPTKPVIDVSNLRRALDVPAEARAVSPTPSNNLSVASNSSPTNTRRGKDSETTSLAQSNVSVARLEKKKALSAEAATLLANLTGPYSITPSSSSRPTSTLKINGSGPSSLSPSAAGGSMPLQTVGVSSRPTSPTKDGVVKLVVDDLSGPPPPPEGTTV